MAPTRSMPAHRTAPVVLFALSLLALVPSTGSAQYPPPPDELSVAVGGVGSDVLSGAQPTAVLTGAWDYSETWPAVFVLEGELLAGSEALPCRQAPHSRPDNCDDAAFLAGFRFRPRPHNRSGLSPFAGVMAGQYWKGAGSGAEDESFISSHAVLQVGAGIEFRWPRSFQGVRLALDYRRVFDGARDTNQIRSVLSYVIGPRRFSARQGPSS